MTLAPDAPDHSAPVIADSPAPVDVAVPLRSGVDLVHGPDGPVVAVLGEPSRRTASVLSCRLHEALAATLPGADLVVDLGAASAADPAIERVLVCARESAADRGVGFHLR